MSTEKKLLVLLRELKTLEKTEFQLKGSLNTLFKTLKKDIDQPKVKNFEAIEMAKEMIQDIKKKITKAEEQLKEKMELIENMADKLGVA